MKTEEAMHSLALYSPTDPALLGRQAKCMETLYDFNATRPSQNRQRQSILRRLFAEIGKNVYIEPPLHCNWGCYTHLGNNVYANFNLTLVDDTHIHIGDSCMIGPNVVITAAGHPVLPELRLSGLQFNAPVHIGSNVWLGAGVIILPGVTIGEHSVIGAGSVVTKDIPQRVVAAGNPCRIMRPIGPKDELYYFKDRTIPWEQWKSSLEQRL